MYIEEEYPMLHLLDVCGTVSVSFSDHIPNEYNLSFIVLQSVFENGDSPLHIGNKSLYSPYYTLHIIHSLSTPHLNPYDSIAVQIDDHKLMLYLLTGGIDVCSIAVHRFFISVHKISIWFILRLPSTFKNGESAHIPLPFKIYMIIFGELNSQMYKTTPLATLRYMVCNTNI